MTSVDASIKELVTLRDRKSVCATELADGPWAFDKPFKAVPEYGPGASQNDSIPPLSPMQGQIPQEYRVASNDELTSRIWAAKKQLGDHLTILGHYYQRDEIVQFADFLGDSFQLAQQARQRDASEFIVFCGVYFMAEMADILSRPNQTVILPNLAAGCSMADMADTQSVESCWQQLTALYGNETVVPVTYMNSSASLKAFCGANGGIVCTSSNADAVLRWAFERSNRVLFFPDQHLGRNTAKHLGISLDEMPVWNPRQPLGGNDEAKLHEANVILWKGYCSVHKRFTVSQIEKARREYPDVRVIVHPECPMDVVDAADEYGSTQYILNAVQNAPAGSTFAIGTEINMVRRLANEHPEHTIFCLDPIICPCSTMYRIHPAYLAWVLESLVQGNVVNEIKVDELVAQNAQVALERMLAVTK
jgi:quinolinate synthase